MPRIGLNSVRVLEVAAQLADAEGLPSVTFARLASDLKVKAPSLYNHWTSLDALRDGLAQRGLEELVESSSRAVAGLAGRDALYALAHAQREYAKKRPGLYAATQFAVSNQSEATRQAGTAYVQLALAALRGYGLDNEQALHAVRATRACVRGFIDIELGGGFGLPLDLDVSFERLLDMIHFGLKGST